MVAARLRKKTRFDNIEAVWVYCPHPSSCCLDLGKPESGINLGSVPGETVQIAQKKTRKGNRRTKTQKNAKQIIKILAINSNT